MRHYKLCAFSLQYAKPSSLPSYDDCQETIHLCVVQKFWISVYHCSPFVSSRSCSVQYSLCNVLIRKIRIQSDWNRVIYISCQHFRKDKHLNKFEKVLPVQDNLFFNTQHQFSMKKHLHYLLGLVVFTEFLIFQWIVLDY